MSVSSSDSRRIAIVGNQAFTLIRFRGSLICTLVNCGYTVFAFTSDATEADRKSIRALGATPVTFRLDRTGMNPLSDFFTVLSLAQRFRQYKIEMALCYFIKPVIYGLWAARIAGVQTRFALIEGLGSAFAENNNRTLKQKVLYNMAVVMYRSALRYACKVFFLNKDDEHLFIDMQIVNATQTVVLPGIGIDLHEYNVAAQPESPITFLMMARLIGQKGVREYAAAAAAVKTCYPHIRFILLGGLETNPDKIAEKEVKAWVVDGILEWPGCVSNVQEWLERTHVFVLPSYYREGLPRSTLEAMAKGRAIITTDTVGCKDTVWEGENGFIVPVRDSHSLKAAMEKIIKEPALIERMGAASRQLAEKYFDVQDVNRRFMQEMDLKMVAGH